jgi:hypothetical protein
MSKVRVSNFALSIDGYGAGPGQNLENPLGVNGLELMEGFFHTRVWRQMHGEPDGETGIDNEIAALGFANFGAWILGRNMGRRPALSHAGLRFDASPAAATQNGRRHRVLLCHRRH